MHDFYETENECNVAAVHKNYVTRGRSCTAARCFYKWDGLWTNWGQKAGHLSGRSSWNIFGKYVAYVGKWIFRFSTAACTA